MKLLRMFALVGALLTSTAHGDLVNPEVPSWQGSAGTAHYGWNSFTSAYGAPNFPDFGNAGGAMLYNFAPGATITSSGNLYNPTGGLDIHIYGYGPLTQAVLNLASGGTEFDYDSVTLVAYDAIGNSYAWAADTSSINSYEADGWGGFNVSSSFTWDVGDLGMSIAEWGFLVQGTAPHNSLDAASVDVAMAPVPAPGALLLLGAFGLSSTRNRRRVG